VGGRLDLGQQDAAPKRQHKTPQRDHHPGGKIEFIKNRAMYKEVVARKKEEEAQTTQYEKIIYEIRQIEKFLIIASRCITRKLRVLKITCGTRGTWRGSSPHERIQPI